MELTGSGGMAARGRPAEWRRAAKAAAGKGGAVDGGGGARCGRREEAASRAAGPGGPAMGLSGPAGAAKWAQAAASGTAPHGSCGAGWTCPAAADLRF